MERCSGSPVTRLAALCCLLVAWSPEGASEKAEPVTAQATPTPLWAVVWGPTHPLEDETPHLPSAQEASRPTATEGWAPHQSSPTTQTQQLPEELPGGRSEGADDLELEDVDPQFYVTVTISSLLIVTAVIITAKLCYDRSCPQQPPPLSRGTAPPLSLALPRSLASEDSRQTLHSIPSFSDRERIPVVNL